MTMLWHLSEEKLLEVVDGIAAPAAREHVAGCDACRARVAEALETWTRAADSGVPEPSTLYWEAFRRRVSRRIAGEPRRTWRPLWLLPAAAAGLLAVLLVPRSHEPKATPSPLALPAWSALPAAEDDDGLAVLQAVASSDSDMVTGFERSGVQEIVFDLSDDESLALAERLRAEAGKGGVL